LDLRGRKWCKTGEYCIMRSFITCTLNQILLLGDQIKKYEMEWARSMHGMRKTKFWSGNLDERDHFLLLKGSS